MDTPTASAVNAATNETPELCAVCGGRCCNRLPGATDPSEWGSSETEMLPNLVSALRSGRYTVDWWEGDPTGGDLALAYFVRAAARNDEGIKHASWGGSCVMLAAMGCSLPFASRPRECRELTALPTGKCVTKWWKEDSAVAWVPYQHLIVEAMGAAESSRADRLAQYGDPRPLAEAVEAGR